MAKKKKTDFDVESILQDFADLPDPRSHINQRHLLGDVIVVSIMAVIAGAEGPKAIGVWAKSNEDWLTDRLQLPNGIPSHDTIGRVLMTIKPSAFQVCFERWIKRLSGNRDKGELDVIAIDGKALRRSHDKAADFGPLFLVSAWAVQRGISLGQLATEEKSNEITAIPELLDQIEIADSVVTIDAAGCQKNIAAKIIDSKGNYVLALKGNQGTLHDAVIEYIIRHMENDFRDVPARRYTERLKGHGRKDELVYYQLPVPNELIGREKWKGMKTIGVVIRMSEKGNKFTTDVRYYISSLALGVKRFAACVRGHWGIENTLHWCLDVTFREDENRVRNRTLADNLAWLKRFAISLLKQVEDKESIAMRRRMAGWNTNFLAQVLGIPTS
ncbi:ISAs1 family transposase [Rhodopirellula baltica]|uniref:Transposase IS4 family protein n=1 Tax=Rhodopirellula baltica WH47 TaxID=991778 RepID=F2B2A1_RHOBT|nr:ISAs1 family transposase [Rhodopirellula baltica]EGF23957.1 transposase IS4 family protein [Rhodopirellula baltica WH47]